MLLRRPRQPWQPCGYPRMALWLDASLPGTMALSSGVVDAWQSRGADGRSLIGATTARPAWSATAGGTSKPGVSFDGTDDVLTRAEAFMYAAGACACFMVATAASPATGRYVLSEGSTASTTPSYVPWRMQAATATTAVSVITSDAAVNFLGNTPTGGTSFNATPTLLARVDSGTTMFARKNGAAGNSGAYTRSATTLNTFALGALARATPTSFAPFTAHELIIVLGTMDTVEVQRIEGYLGWKWGITLDATSPYYSAPP